MGPDELGHLQNSHISETSRFGRVNLELYIDQIWTYYMDPDL